MCFLYPPHKNFEMMTHFVHLECFGVKSPQANAETRALSKIAILPNRNEKRTIIYTFEKKMK